MVIMQVIHNRFDISDDTQSWTTRNPKSRNKPVPYNIMKVIHNIKKYNESHT